MWSNSQNGNSEIPIFPITDKDKAFGPKLPLVFEAMVFPWLMARPSVAHEDKDPARMVTLIREEIDEAQTAHSNDEMRHSIIELADVIFFLSSFRFGLLLNNPSIPQLDVYKVYHKMVVTKVGDGIYDQLKETTGDLVVGGEKSLLALEQLYVKTLALWKELIELGDPFLIMSWVTNIKNIKNFPAEAADGLDPITKKPLSPDERRLQHDHSRATLKLLRDANGRPVGGLDKSFYHQHRRQVFDFRGGQSVLHDLRQQLGITNRNGVK